MPLTLADFDYVLPPELIAQTPLPQRSSSRLLVLDGDLAVVSASRSFYQCFQLAPEETLGRPIDALGQGQWNIAALRERLEAILPSGEPFDDYLVDGDFPLVGRCRLRLNARRVIGKIGAPRLILLAMQPE